LTSSFSIWYVCASLSDRRSQTNVIDGSRQYLPAYAVTLENVDFDVDRAICRLSPLGFVCLQGPLLQHASLYGKMRISGALWHYRELKKLTLDTISWVWKANTFKKSRKAPKVIGSLVSQGPTLI
jgi:hypothetical protein